VFRKLGEPLRFYRCESKLMVLRTSCSTTNTAAFVQGLSHTNIGFRLAVVINTVTYGETHSFAIDKSNDLWPSEATSSSDADREIGVPVLLGLLLLSEGLT